VREGALAVRRRRVREEEHFHAQVAKSDPTRREDVPYLQRFFKLLDRQTRPAPETMDREDAIPSLLGSGRYLAARGPSVSAPPLFRFRTVRTENSS
jgi:hypothetical protein